MHPELVYQHLEDLAEQLGISMRHEDLRYSETPVKSGLCKLKGCHFYLMDSSKDISERIRLLSQCIGRMDLEGVYVVPAIREFLQGQVSSNKESA